MNIEISFFIATVMTLIWTPIMYFSSKTDGRSFEIKKLLMIWCYLFVGAIILSIIEPSAFEL